MTPTPKRKRWFAGTIVVLMGAAIAGVAPGLLGSHSADAVPVPFTPVSATNNIAALNQTALVATPAITKSLGPDLQPTAGTTHALGSDGFIWSHSGETCAVMVSGSGGCFTAFTKPVVLFLSGTESHQGTYSDAWAEGIVPNTVGGLTLNMANGTSVSAPLSDNAFRVSVPAGVGITGYTVTLTSGTVFTATDPVTVPQLAH
jgi:hypothetical protein